MISTSEIQNLLTSGGTVVGDDGASIGKVSQVFLDDRTGDPEWVTVTTGLFGTGESFVPLGQASVRGDEVVVPYDKSTVKGAPRVADSSGHLSEAEEAELYRYYGLDDTGGVDADDTRHGTTSTGTGTAGYGDATAVNQHGTVGHDTSGPTTDSAMTRSEERLHVGTERVATGRARLRKYVVTEQETVTVPVSREEVRLEREPITDANVGDALSGPAISEEEHEVVLTEERPVVDKETVPVERVRLDTDVVTETETVTEDVRKEQIELGGDADTRRGTTGL
ncbi:DUF2382 domain-containing protein [Cellulomonas aerilata]|uniref:Photosystem reaction center subunit H n=1 Tax=Cellulomonas aerilata TaxID=515326 RepID=A0A512DE89_9CELL|nr:PRC and DUF2382 domain-containing protein [Cellulomonas aerilata]GEO34777.1 photosystem reaction center subunit H [Cellulomonas aerilata]